MQAVQWFICKIMTRLLSWQGAFGVPDKIMVQTACHSPSPWRHCLVLQRPKSFKLPVSVHAGWGVTLRAKGLSDHLQPLSGRLDEVNLLGRKTGTSTSACVKRTTVFNMPVPWLTIWCVHFLFSLRFQWQIDKSTLNNKNNSLNGMF